MLLYVLLVSCWQLVDLDGFGGDHTSAMGPTDSLLV